MEIAWRLHGDCMEGSGRFEAVRGHQSVAGLRGTSLAGSALRARISSVRIGLRMAWLWGAARGSTRPSFPSSHGETTTATATATITLR